MGRFVTIILWTSSLTKFIRTILKELWPFNFLRKWFPLNNLNNYYWINLKLHGKVRYHNTVDKFVNQIYSDLFKRVIAL
ncbi:hypothetical protein CI610_03593 [invertebrate metagenome]|uniref:Uncharacterized protein n=1 Tax=invertebrate metagenome TaxID=1711999 RepID=A0A2H9T2R9_9ZZZZ